MSASSSSRADRLTTALLALATVTGSCLFLAGLVVEPRVASADATRPSDGFDPDALDGSTWSVPLDGEDTFSSSEPAKGMGGGMGMSSMGGGGGGGGAAGGGTSGGSTSGGSTGGGSSGQPTSGGNFTGGGGMASSGSSGAMSGPTTGAMSGGATSTGGAAAGKNGKATASGSTAGGGKSSATSSKASKARISWMVAQQKARMDAALEGIYHAEIDALNDGALKTLRRAACAAGAGPTAPTAVTPGAPAPAPVPAPVPAPEPAPATPPVPEKPPTLADGSPLPKGADELQALAEKSEKAEKFDDAILAAHALVKIRGSANDWTYVGYLEEVYGSFDEATVAYDKALAIQPTHVGAKSGKLFVAVDTGQATGCIEGLTKDANIPKNEVLWLLATVQLNAAAKLAEPARAALEEAIGAAGQDLAKIRAAIELGIEAKVRGPLLAALDICLRSAPDDARFRGLRLVLKVEEGPPVVALKDLESEAKLAPTDIEPLLFQAYLQIKDEKHEKALSILKMATAMAPKHGRCALLEAHTLDRKGSKETLAGYAIAAELDPKVAEPWIASALIVHNKADYEDAEGKLNAAIRAEPRNPEPLYYLAIIQGDRQGLLGKAQDTLEIYRRLGGEEEAALEWLESLEAAENN